MWRAASSVSRMMAEILIERISKTYATARPGWTTSADIRDREFMVLLGPSGCGKTTLLRWSPGSNIRNAGR